MTGPYVDADLEAELDVLFGLQPDGFVAARDDLVRRLRSAGRGGDAASVKRLRRPTVAAWALNQLSRRRGDDVRRLIREGDDLRRVQQDLLAGRGREQLRAATTARRATLDALADAALVLLAGDRRTSPEAHRDDVLATLEAASREPAAGAALLRGRLSTGLAPTAGFDLPGDTSPPLSGSRGDAGEQQPETRRAAGRHPATDAVAHQARLAEARQVAVDARALAERRRTEAAELAEMASRARRAAREAGEEVERLARELERARRSASRATSAAEDAAARVTGAERVAAKAVAQATTAEAAVARLEES